MNWLAHLHLARDGDDDALLGALLGDFAFGTSGLDRWGPVVHREILVHRRVDRFTDTHPRVASLREAFAPGRRRYAGIVLDVYFDHLLARDWARWSDVPLDAFTARAYDAVQARWDALPPRLQAIAPRMRVHDWLGGYRERANVDLAVTRIATRLSRHGDRLVDALTDLVAVEPAARSGFDAFYAELDAFAQRTRAQLAAG